MSWLVVWNLLEELVISRFTPVFKWIKELEMTSNSN